MKTFSLENQKTAGFSTYLAIGSFGIGTVLFLLHFIFPFLEYKLLYIIGYFYVLLAVLVNGIAFINLLFKFFTKTKKREDLAIKMLILLANIPIAMLYFYIIFQKINHI